MAIIDAIATIIVCLGQGLAIGLGFAALFTPFYILIWLTK